METRILKFKTNVNCGHCLAKITPYLNAVSDIDNWFVDLASEDKILTTEGSMTAEMVVEALNLAGYRAELIDKP